MIVRHRPAYIGGNGHITAARSSRKIERGGAYGKRAGAAAANRNVIELKPAIATYNGDGVVAGIEIDIAIGFVGPVGIGGKLNGAGAYFGAIDLQCLKFFCIRS